MMRRHHLEVSLVQPQNDVVFVCHFLIQIFTVTRLWCHLIVGVLDTLFCYIVITTMQTKVRTHNTQKFISSCRLEIKPETKTKSKIE